MDCPICNTVIKDIYRMHFCPTCQWELAVISTEASPEMKAYFKKRQKVFQKVYSSLEKKQKMEEELAELVKEKENLESWEKVLKGLVTTQASIDSTEKEIQMCKGLAQLSQDYQEKLNALKVAYEYAINLGGKDSHPLLLQEAKALLKMKVINL